MAYIAGDWQAIDFSQWPEECQMSVSFALGYGEQQAEVMKWMGLHKTLSEVPSLAGQYTPQQQYNVLRNSILASGIKDVNNYLLPPNKAQQPPPNPMMQAEIAMKQADAAVKQANAQAAAANVQLEIQKLQSEERIALAKINLETMRAQAEIQLKRDELAHKVTVDAAEIGLQHQAQQQDKLQAEAVPTH